MIHSTSNSVLWIMRSSKGGNSGDRFTSTMLEFNLGIATYGSIFSVSQQ